MTAPPKAPPTAHCCFFVNGQDSGHIGVDLVMDVVDGLVHILVPIGNDEKPPVRLGFRLSFTPEQLAVLMDELVDCSEVTGEGAPW